MEEDVSDTEGSDSREIHLPMPVEPEVDPSVYVDVESILFTGFLTLTAEFQSVRFVFKTLNHHELKMLKLTAPDQMEEFWGSFFAYSVFLVDGQNVLPERDKWFGQFSEAFKAMGSETKVEVIRRLSELNRRSNIAVPLTEAYSLEKQSRYRWLQLKGLDLTSTQVTGIDGTNRLGLNWGQQLWRAINHAEDRAEKIESDWELTKFLGSCFAGKGMKKVYDKDVQRRRKEIEDRIARKDAILREHVLGESPAMFSNGSSGMMVHARTEKELMRQLENDLRGEKDWHDQVVADHEARLKAAYQERLDAMETNQKAFDQKFEGRRVITKEEAQNFSAVEVPAMEEKHQEVIQKWYNRDDR